MKSTFANILSAACLLVCSEASENDHRNLHVRLLNRGYTVRNANSDTSDGQNSVSGPCGGNNVWGSSASAPRFTNAIDEQTFCTTIQYNGGHKSAANVFRATFACGEPGDENSFASLESLPLVAGTTPDPSTEFLVPAPRGNEQEGGYTLCIDLPPQGLSEAVSTDSPLRKCTISVMDQRDWGGCVDLMLADVPQVPTAPPTPSPTVALENRLQEAEGTYAFAEDCDQEAGGECCLEGYVGLSTDGSVSMKAWSVPHAGLTDVDASCPEGEIVAFSELLEASGTKGPGALASPVITLQFAGGEQAEEFQLVVRDPGQSITVTNVGSALPKNSDTTAIFLTTLEAGLANGDVPTPSDGNGGESSNDAGVIAGVIIGCLVAGIALFGLKKKGYIGGSANKSSGNGATQMSYVPGRASKNTRSAGWKAGNEGRSDALSVKKDKTKWMNNAESVV